MSTYTTYWLDGSEVVHYYPGEYDIDPALPPLVQQAVKRLIEDDFDSAKCQAANHPDDVSKTVGWGLYGDADEKTRFTECAAVTDGERSWVVCEHCHAALEPQP